MYATIYLYRPSRGEENFVINTDKLTSTKDTIETALNQQNAFVELDKLEVDEVMHAKSIGITGLVLDVHQVN